MGGGSTGLGCLLPLAAIIIIAVYYFGVDLWHAVAFTAVIYLGVIALMTVAAITIITLVWWFNR